MSVASEIQKLHKEIPADVVLVAVSKFHPAEAIEEAYNAGQRVFGESRVQELLAKIPVLPPDIQWHFIGHLQTNKVRQIVGKVALIESIDTLHLLDTVDRESEKAGTVSNVLMQVHVAREETKFGFHPDELFEFFNTRRFEALKATHICGIMGMASNTSDENRILEDFRKLNEIFTEIQNNTSLGLRGFDILSMGMSHDWPLAVMEGSNSVRIGTAIFGERDYNHAP